MPERITDLGQSGSGDEHVTLFVPVVLTEAQAIAAMVACHSVAVLGDRLAQDDDQRERVTDARAASASLGMALDKARTKAAER